MRSDISRRVMFAAGFLLLLAAAGAMLFDDCGRTQEVRLNDSVREILAQEKAKPEPPGEAVRFRLPDGESSYAEPFSGKLSDFRQNRDRQNKVRRLLELNRPVRSECSRICRLHQRSAKLFRDPSFLNFVIFFYCDQMAWAHFQEDKAEALRIVQESLYFAQNFTDSDIYFQHLRYERLNHLWLEWIYVPFREKFPLNDTETEDLRRQLEDVRSECVSRTCRSIRAMLTDAGPLSARESERVLKAVQANSMPVFRHTPPPKTLSEHILRQKEFANFFVSRLDEEIGRLGGKTGESPSPFVAGIFIPAGIRSDPTMPIELLRVKRLCQKRDFEPALDLLRKACGPVQEMQFSAKEPYFLRIYNCRCFFDKPYRDDPFFASLQDRIDRVRPPLYMSETEAGEWAKFWYFSGRKDCALPFLHTVQAQKARFFSEGGCVRPDTYGELLEYEIRNGDLSASLRILCRAQGMSVFAKIGGFFSVPYQMIGHHPLHCGAWLLLIAEIAAVPLILLLAAFICRTRRREKRKSPEPSDA